jgi:hypothetical protein
LGCNCIRRVVRPLKKIAKQLAVIVSVILSIAFLYNLAHVL